ncbi:hypothetical protein F511_45191 [Dorcoceras hygrometricum]|uniref:Uncharacterized protein n=1 Tax=Dorcoceras hygrometricum TaxID=472368 RepID=A0A2Z6ZWN0_9LAMI|nr:hypothetical protein F511_45191 [Dorcoceras hygrometricum]
MRATRALASSSAIAALLIGRDLRALSRMAGVHSARGAPPRRALAVQLEADDVAPLRAWWPVAAAPRRCYWLRKMLRHGREVAGLMRARCRWSAAFCRF